MKKQPPKYIQAKNKIKDNIKRSVFVDKLPGERVLAEELGVSYMTVRKAVAELVEEGILYKAGTKGTYVNNGSGGNGNKTTHNIGFFLDDRIREGISSPYYSLIFHSLEKEVIKNGYNLIYFSNFDDLNPLKSKKKIDGVVISCFPRLENQIRDVKKLMPVVLIDNASSDKSIPSVTIDNFNGIVDSFHYLWSLGHRRIGFITGLQDSNVGKDRLKGYKSALISRDIPVDSELIYTGDYSYKSGEKGATYLLSLKERPTAIMCANDSMAIGAIKAIREKGFSIPDDISIIGFDDIDVASQVHPSLTTMAVPIKQIANTSIDILTSLIEGDDLDYQHTILPARLVVRNSCAPVKK
jgi:DNA-binding LacI/PurR family transcriptional regulator